MVNIDNSKSYLKELVRLNNYDLVAIGYQQLTVSGTAVSLTIPTNTRYARIQVESSIATPAIRFLQLGDINLPTASTGVIRSNLDVFDIAGNQNLINFRAIQVGAGTHKLNIEYFK